MHILLYYTVFSLYIFAFIYTNIYICSLYIYILYILYSFFFILSLFSLYYTFFYFYILYITIHFSLYYTYKKADVIATSCLTIECLDIFKRELIPSKCTRVSIKSMCVHFNGRLPLYGVTHYSPIGPVYPLV